MKYKVIVYHISIGPNMIFTRTPLGEENDG